MELSNEKIAEVTLAGESRITTGRHPAKEGQIGYHT